MTSCLGAARGGRALEATESSQNSRDRPPGTHRDLSVSMGHMYCKYLHRSTYCVGLCQLTCMPDEQDEKGYRFTGSMWCCTVLPADELQYPPVAGHG